MTIKPSSHPSAGWHKGDCHPSSRRSLCCSCAISSLSTRSTEWLHMAMWQFFFSPFQLVSKPRKWLVEPARGSSRYRAGCPKGQPLLSPCCLHVTTTTSCCPSQSCRAPSPPAVLGFHPCSHFECNTSPGLKRNPAGETLLLESKENYCMETLMKGPRERNAQDHVVKEHCSIGNMSLKTVVRQPLSQHSHRAKRWRRELGQHSPLAVVQSSCKGS